jgi:cob(I)alamin adenosyltransferase
MSIVTRRGDKGKTDLIGRVRVSKTNLRVECYGTLDELNAQLGLARSLSADTEVRDKIEKIQRELFTISAAVATPPDSKTSPPQIDDEMVQRLDDQVSRIEEMDGILGDWALPGERSDSAALDVARTVCRRAERCAVRVAEQEELNPNILVYLNRLSDLLWLFGRLIEVRSGVDSALRPGKKKRSGAGRPVRGLRD